MPLERDASEVLGRVGARSAAESSRFSLSIERGARATAAELRSATAVRSAERAGFQTSTRSAVETEEAPARKPREARGRAAARFAERAGFQTSARSAVETEEAPARKPREARGRAAARFAERAGFQTSTPSAVETEEAPVREVRGRTAVRHIPAAVPANPGRTARERRGEPLRPQSRARVVAGRRGGVACQTATRPAVRWPWLFAIAFAACLIVTGLGVFGSGVSSGPVPSRTASVSVQPGDSLGALAARFAPNADQSAVVERIKELNNLDDTALLPGMPLTVPVAWSGNGSAGEAGEGSASAG
ncbi:LysM peptidoglycan-binding domain-containing protein [Amycolatopsis halotolerans]|uniref:LysM peptidoglycan-binding domain-containing protein n=2 Tax=Amycolatopsis halotolerans TaxID=330083 RepID=A0ABV7QS15_9PSEU